MGCTQSKSTTDDVAKQIDPPAPSPDADVKATEAEDPTSIPVTFGGVTVRYAFVSKRGNYPNDPNKPNQDSFTVKQQFAGKKSDAFFAVFDGHGEKGHECSQFVRDKLPPLVANAVGNGAGMTDEKFDTVLKWGHTTCSKKLNKSRVDDMWSGTTSISVYLHGDLNKITVSNVGDSRAVIGSCAPSEREARKGSLVATALSNDQTPWRRDERERITSKGGRILTEDQLFGKGPAVPFKGEMVLGDEIDESGQPPRVFSAKGDYPGLSVTRTIGDKMISDERVGVYAEPEILTRVLTPQDKVIFLASDGVFEFITNKTVIDMCSECTDPLEACKRIVDKSYKLWMENDTRSDDITMICIFLDDVRPIEE